MIKPTVGRVVLFQPSQNETIPRNGNEPLAAIVTCVWSDTCVNLVVFDANGNSHSRTSVPLIQDDNPVPSGYYAHWMPYQISQAAKEAVQPIKAFATGLQANLYTHNAHLEALWAAGRVEGGNNDVNTLLANAKAILAWLEPSEIVQQPPVDNAHVAEGCEQFAESNAE